MKSFFKYLFPLVVIGFIAGGAHIRNTADRPLAFVQKFKPSVGIIKKGQFQDVRKRGKPLYNGDTLRTNENGFALVQFMDKSLAKIRPDSRLVVRGKVENKENTSTRIGLELGEIFLNVSKQGANNFEVATNTSVASVKGTKFGASVDDYFWVEEGEVQVLVNRTGESVMLTDRSYGQVREDGTIETGELTDDEIEEKNEDYAQMNDKMEPEIYRLQFIDENGQQREIEIKIFENNN